MKPVTVKTILKAEIRNVDIHVIQLEIDKYSNRRFQAIWCAKGANLDSIQNSLQFKKFMSTYPDCNAFYRPVMLSSALRRFKQMCRVAQDTRITFEV